MNATRKLTLVCLAVIIALPAFAQEAPKVEHKYVGVAGCKACHLLPKSGAAFAIWQKSKHAQAYAALASEKALAIGKEKGIAEPQKSEQCLSCHVTAYGVAADLTTATHKIEDGVGCESCHGPGSDYKAKKVMEDLNAGTVDPASVGLKKSKEEDCKRCHNDKSPTFTAFDFEKMSAQIAHPTPEPPAK